MCDNTAVSWSEYDSHQRNSESAFREKIARELLEHIRFCDLNGMPEMYLNGLERARTLVLTGTPVTSETRSPWSQERLI